LAAAAGAGAASALLAACGGGSDDGSAAVSDRSGLLAQPQVTTKNAAPGGVWQSYRIRDVTQFDPMDAQVGVLLHALNAYSQPVKFKTGTPDNVPDGSFEGDAAQSWERSGDGTQLTFKVRPNVKFDPRPPTSGRAMDAEDYLFTWEKFSTGTPAGAELSNKRNPDAPIESWSAPDKSTVVIKLAFPYAPILEALADTRYSFVLVPVEHGKGYDPRSETRGSGPWLLSKWEQSVRLEWRRNPNYYDSPHPFLDGIDEPIVSEYAQRLAQFKAGNIWSWTGSAIDLRQEDVLPLKQDHPELEVWANQTFRLSHPSGTPTTLAFSALPDSPFRDVRVRRGFSMLIDRDLILETFNNLGPFREAGIELDSRFHTLVSCADDRFWVDPKGKGLGEAAENFKYNPEEAGRLLNAAGIRDLDVPYHAASISRESEALVSMLSSTGFFKLRAIVHQAQDYQANYHRGNGRWDGVTVNAGGSSVHPSFTMVRYNASSEFRNYPEALPYEPLLRKAERELDPKKQAEIWTEVQKQWATLLLPDVIGPAPGIAQTLNVKWPWLANLGAELPYVNNAAPEAWKKYWYDPTKRKTA
jgi:ABC-type transport system substrate-binding protein